RADDVAAELAAERARSNGAVEQLVQQLATLRATAPVVSGNAEKGYALVGDVLICWGRADLQPGPGPENAHVRLFSFTFPCEFESNPAVTTGFDLVSGGNVFGVYSSRTTAASFSGYAFDNKSGPDVPGIGDVPVAMS